MSHSRNEVKVGIFVLVGLVLLGALMLQFSKGTSSFRKTYEIRLKAKNIGGLRKNSFVLVSGVQVGSVSDIRLSEDARTVTLVLKIFSNFKIHGDARFIIEQSGFLGDQYVGVVPTENKLPVLQPGAEVRAEEPFNLQEAARSAIGFVQRADDSVNRINRIIDDLGKHLLNPQTMTNLAFAVVKFRQVSEEALVTVANISSLVSTNSPVISQSLSNVSTFSKKLGQAGESVQQLITDNRPQIDAAIKNLEAASITLTNLLNGVQSGKGLAGTVIGNETVASNFAHVVENLSITTSNLNRLGLWRMLWKPREAKSRSTNSPAPAKVTAPKDN